MQQAVIVSAARTGLAKSFRGSFNQTHGAAMGGHVVQHAVVRAGIDPATVEDCIMGNALTQGLAVEDVKAWPEIIDSITEDEILAAARSVLDRRQAVTGWLRPPGEAAGAMEVSQ